MKISKVKARERIDILREQIDIHNRRYYVENQPIITDFEYDLLIQELQTLESAFPEFFTTNSPTVRVGSDLSVSNDGKSTTQWSHKYPMLSLSNTYDKAELYSFNERVKKLIGDNFTYVCELKFDGAAISLSYSNFKLLRAVTRGDGTTGEDVTKNIETIPTVPKEISRTSSIGDFEVRGEVYMTWDSFDTINTIREKNQEPLFANPRNAAAGSLKLLDSAIAEQRELKLVIYSVVEENNFFNTHLEYLKWARESGFPTSEFNLQCKNIEEVISYVEKWDEKRKDLNYPTDGVVIKVNEIWGQRVAGATAKSPRWATSYKFKAEQAESKILSIDYQVGRTGAVTPVANLQPVLLSGTVVKRASLHNEDQMRLLDIHLGDSVYVEKGGEIIPKIVGVNSGARDYRSEVPQFPSECPECGSKLKKEEIESKWFCTNSLGCPPQIKGRLLHFASRKAMDILAGEATIEQMVDLGYLKDFTGFYTTGKDQLLMMEGWKERSAERFLESVEKSKSKPFYCFIYALGIRHIGETTAKSLALHFKEMKSLMSASLEELKEVEDIGEIMAASLYSYFRDEANIEMINKLEIIGVKMDSNLEESKRDVTAILSGKSFVISGIFTVSREELKSIIEYNSGKVSSSVSSSTDYLVAGENTGPSKLEKAKKLGVKIINQDEFFSLIN